MMATLLTIIIVSQSQYWGMADLPTNIGVVENITAADGRNDGINRMYVTCDNAGTPEIYELTHTAFGWDTYKIPLTSHYDNVYAIATGVGRNDNYVRLYVGVHHINGNHEVLEYTWMGYDWGNTGVAGRTYDETRTITIGTARNDGVHRVYIASLDGDVWESTHQTNGEYLWQLIRYAEIMPTGLTVADARNDGVMRLYYCGQGSVWEGFYQNSSWTFTKLNVNDCATRLDLCVGKARNDDFNRVYVSLCPELACSGYEYEWTGNAWIENAVIGISQTSAATNVCVADARLDGSHRVYWSASDTKGKVIESSWQNGCWQHFEFGYSTYGYATMSAGNCRNDGKDRIYTYCQSPSTNGYEHSYLPKLPSNSNHATAFNEQPHLARMPNTENLLVVHQSSNKIYFSESYDGGTTWDLPQVIGDGILPAIGLTGFGSPCVTFLSPDGQDLIYKYRDPMMMQWLGFTVFDGNFALRPEQASMFMHNTAADSVRLAFRVADLNNEQSFIYYADFPWYETNAASHSYPIDPYQVPPDFIDRRSPSISVDMFNQLHVAWQRADQMTGLGETYYRYRDVSGNWSPIYNVSQTPEPSVYPHCEGYGDSVFVHWSEELSSQNLDVKRASRWIFRPINEWNYFPIPPTPDSSIFPVCAMGEYSVWSEKTNNTNFEIYYWNRTTHQIGNISNTPNRSWFGHSNYYQSIMGFPTLYTCWTESLYADAYEVQFNKLGGLDWGNEPFVCFYSVPVGDSTLSQYTIRRKGRTYWTNRKIWADYDSTALIYKLLCPNPKFLYKIIAVPYQEKGSQWSARFTADNFSVRTVSFDSGVWDTFQFWLPETTYKYDKTVNLRIEKISGEYVPIACLRVYQFEKKKTIKEGGYAQGAQSTESREISVRTQLKQVSPNPANKNINIAYSLSKNARATLKIFDISGRLVKTLVGFNQTSGLHSLLWDGKDNRGLTVKNGVYFIEMKTNDYKATKKLIILK